MIPYAFNQTPRWLSSSPSSGVVAPGASAQVALTFDASGLMGGVYAADVVVSSNDPEAAETLIPATLTVTGAPDLTILGEEVSADSVQSYSTDGARTSHHLPATASPEGGGTLTVLANGDFGFEGETATVIAEGNVLGTVGPVGTDCAPATRTFTLSPGLLANLIADGRIDVEIQNSPEVNVFCSINSHSVHLQYSGPADSLNFGPVFIGVSRSMGLTVRNDGTDLLVVSPIGTDSSSFSASPSNLSLQPGASAPVTVTLDASHVGDFTGNLSIATNDPDTPLVTIPLTGQGVMPPILGIAPSSIQSTLLNGGQETHTLTLTNTGGSDLTFSLAASALAGGAVTVPFAGLSSDNGVSDNQPSSAPQSPPASFSLLQGVPGDFERLASSPVPLTCVVEDPVAMTLYAQANNSTGFYRYRAASNVWEPLASAPVTSGNNGGAALLNGKIYTVYTQDNFTMGVYDIAANSWSTRANPLGQGTGNIASDGGTYLYLVFGNQFVRFDPAAGTSAPLPVPPFAFNPWGGLRFLSGRLYGHQGNGAAGFARFDVASNAWTLLPSTPGGAVLGSAIDPVNQQYFAYGSYSGTNLYRFSFSSETWNVLTVPFFNLNDGGMGWLPGPVPGIYFIQGQDGTGLARLITGVPFLSVSPLSGTVPAGGSAEIEALFEAGNLFGGVYNARIDITSNDPAHPLTSIPASLTVIGAPNIDVQPTSLTFPSTFTGYSKSLSLTLLNLGTEALHISGVRLEGEFSQTGLTPPETIPIGGSRSITVTFSPTAPGTATGRLLLDSDDPDEPSLVVPLTGSAIRPPILGIAPSSLQSTLLNGGQEAHTLTLTNTGESDLTFSIGVNAVAGEVVTVPFAGLSPNHGVSGNQPSSAPQPPPAGSSFYQGVPGDFERLASSPVPLTCVVEDPFALTLYAQANNGTGFYRYRAASNVWEPLASAPVTSGNNGGAALLNGKIYTVYTQNTSTMGVYDIAANSWSTRANPLGQGTGNIASDGSRYLYLVRGSQFVRFDPEAGTSANLPVPPFAFNAWGGLRFLSGRLYGHQGDGSAGFARFDVVSNAWTLLPSTPGGAVLGSAIDPVNQQYFAYGDYFGTNLYRFSFSSGTWSVLTVPFFSLNDGGMGWLPGPVPGIYFIQGEDGTGLARLITGVPFLSVSPPSGTVPAGGSAEIEALFEAGNLFGGVYDARIDIASNDPAHPLTSVPASLTVIGAPNIDVQPTSLTFPSTFTGYSKSLSLTLLNLGTEALHVSGVTLEGEFSQTGLTPPETIPVGGSRSITVTFSPTAPGAATGRLLLDSDDPDTPLVTIPLSGLGLIPPIVGAEPATLGTTLLSGGREDQNLRLVNTGGSPLEFHLSVIPRQGDGSTCVPTRVFVTEYSGGRLAAVDLATGASTTLASGLSYPIGVATQIGGRTAYVTEYGSGELSAVDSVTGAVTTVAGGLVNLEQIALEPGGTALVTQFDGFLSRVDLSTGAVTRIATGLNSPFGVALNPAGSDAFVAEFYSNSLARVNLGTGLITRIVTGLQNPYGLTVDRTGIFAYVTEWNSGTLREVTLTTGATRLVTSGLVRPYGIVLDPAQATAYVSEGSSYISAVDLATGSIRRFAGGLAEPVGVDLDTGASCQPIFMSLEPSSGSIPAGSSLDVLARFDASGMFGGNYLNDIQVASNDPATPLLTVSASLTVIGVPDIAAQPASLTFPSTFTGYHSSLALKIKNTGTEALHISGVRLEGEFSQTGLTTPETIPVGGSRDLTVTFSPTAPGAATGRMILDSDDPDMPSLAVPLSGSSLLPPRAELSPPSIAAVLYTGGTTNAALTLSNTGGSDLSWTVEALQVSGSAVTAEPPLDLAKGESDPRPGVLGSGGPDVFGYRWKDSDAPGGPAFSWTDISATGTPVGIVGDDSTSGPIPIGFSFPFYGNSFATVRVCTNGFLSFTSNSASFSRQPLPSASAPENLLAAFWADLYVETPQSIRYLNDGSRWIVQFTNVRFLGGAGPLTFQVILYPNGRIAYQYQTMSGFGAGPTTGIQNATRDDGLTVAFNTSYVHDNLAVEISRTPKWLSLTPTAGTVAAGGSASLDARMDAAGLLGGDYLARIQLKSNDPANGLIEVPVTLTVIGVPDIDVQPASLTFPSTFTGYQSSLPLAIRNLGSDALHISGVRFEGEFSQTDLTPPVTIPIGGSRNITVTFSPTVPGTASGRLILDSDDPDEPALAVELAGTSLLPPVAAVQPTSLHSQLPQHGVETQTLTLSNTGSSDLTFSLNVGVSALELAVPGAFELLTSSPAPLTCVVEDAAAMLLYAQANNGTGFYRYRAASSVWEVLASAPLHSGNNGGAALLNGKIYTVYTGNSLTMGAYDIAANSWSTLANPLGQGTGNIASDGSRYLYLVRGSQFVRLDPAAGTSATLPAPPFSFNPWGGLRFLSGRLYGHQGDGSAGFARFDVASNAWTLLPSTPGGAVLGSAIDPANQQYFAYGSYSGTNLYRFSINSGTWTTLTVPFFLLNDGGMGWLPGPVPGIYFVQGQEGPGFARLVTAPVFLTLTPTAGTVPPGGTRDIQVQFSAGNLNPATYNASINIATNDPAHSLLSVPATLQVYGDADQDGIPDPFDNCPTVFNPAQENADGDQAGDVCDLCTDTDSDGAGNPGYPVNTCPIDNCPDIPNPAQIDFDRDGLGDACDACPLDAGNDIDLDGLCGNVDNCPGASNPGQENADGDGLGDACDACPADPGNDADADGLCGNVDNCPGASNAGQEDADGDGPGDACDNCPATGNPDQHDANADGSGDACQPVLTLTSIQQDGGSALEVRALAGDPQGSPLSGTVQIYPAIQSPIVLQDALAFGYCESGFLPYGVAGEGIGYLNVSLQAPFLFDLDSILGCSDSLADFEIAPGTCLAPTGPFDPILDLLTMVPPVPICVRKISAPETAFDVSITALDENSITLVPGAASLPLLDYPFSAWPPGPDSLASLSAGESYRMRLVLTDGNTVPVSVDGAFVYHGEPVLLVNNPPTAHAVAASFVECDRPGGGSVLLDGSASQDPDSSPGTHDDIIRFDWVLDAGQLSESLLGTGEVLTVAVPLGSHTVTLRVTDASGEFDAAVVPVSVVDTTAPVLTCSEASILECTSPAGAPATVTASATDACSPVVEISNSRNGSTGDASGVYALGTSPVTFTATDASGNSATCATGVTVRDMVPPVLAVSASQTKLWPPNHRLVPVTLAWQVTDLCSASPSPVLVSATSNELDDAPGDGDGFTTGDISGADLGTADTLVSVRAERLETGSGRTYDLRYESADAAGNVSAVSVLVHVPHDNAPGPDPLQLRLQPGATKESARILWDPVLGATGYDLIMGDLANVSRQPSLLSLGQVTVLAAGTQVTDYLEAPGGPLPAVGKTWFFLMQYRQTDGTPSGYGSVFAALPREPASCGMACP
jgi:sugar lactone lactonase YvrE